MKTCALLFLSLSACQIGGERPLTHDYAAWFAVNGDGTWTRAAEAAVRATSLPDQIPNDIERFCPRYAEIDVRSRVMFWTSLLSAIAKFESGFNTELRYVEKLKDSKGRRVVSRGLLQLSVESANQSRYTCQGMKSVDLHDPTTNLSCGARILSTWVRADGVVAHWSGKNIGGARYWSVLRDGNQSLAKIASTTRRLEFCGT